MAADRYNRRKVAILTQMALGIVAMVLGLTTAWDIVTVWMIFGLVTLQSVAVAFDGPARQALIPSLVPRENLANAYSLTSIASKVGGILGPAISRSGDRLSGACNGLIGSTPFRIWLLSPP